MSICVTGETLTSDIGNSGSRAAAETHQEILEMLVDADADLLSATLRDQLITWLVAYNYPGAAVPEIWRVRPENIKKTAEGRKAVAEAASAENDAILDVVMSAARFDDDDAARDFIVSFGVTSRLSDDTITRLVEARFAFMDGGKRGRDIRQLGLDRLAGRLKKKDLNPLQALFAEEDDWRGSDRVDTVEALVAQFSSAAAPIIRERLDEIRAALIAAGSYEDARSRLASLEGDWAYDRLAPLISAGMELAILSGREAVFREMDGDDDADSFAEPDVFNQPFLEQIEFLRQKRPTPSRAWTDYMHGDHDRAFVVAGATDLAMVEDFHEAVIRAAETLDIKAFGREFDTIVARFDGALQQVDQLALLVADDPVGHVDFGARDAGLFLFRQHRADLHQRLFRRPRHLRPAEGAHHARPGHQRHDLVTREHQRRKVETLPHQVADARLAVDRHAGRLQVGDVAVDRAL